MINKPIGIFDSGVGGLTILQTVKELLPHESFVYVADQAHNPYGGRTAEEIQKLSGNVVSFLVSKNVKLVIVACNTASVSSIDYLRAKFAVPIIAVVPVVKTIAKESKTKHAAVFSTPATAKSTYLKDLIEKFGNGTTIYTIGTSKLEHLVEEGIIDGPQIESAIKASLVPLLEKNVEAVALGCTHYPFVTPAIKKIVGSKMTIYDSGGAIARRAQYILKHERLEASQKSEDYYYTTGDATKFKLLAEKLLKTKLAHVEGINL